MDHPDFNKWLVDDLKIYLLQHDIVLEKGSGKNGRVLKADLVKKASKAYKSESKLFKKSPVKITKKSPVKSEFPIELNDVLPNILGNMNINAVRSLNKKFNAQYPVKCLVYDYIVSKFNQVHLGEDEDENVSDYFSNLEEFKIYEQQQIDALDDKMINYLFYLMYLMKNKAVYTMDKEGSSPYLCNGFFLYKSKLLLMFSDELLLNNHSKGIFKPEIKNASKEKVNIYNFIDKHFDNYDYERMVDYYFQDNDLKAPTLKQMMIEQKKTLTKSDDDMIDFLMYTINLINKHKMVNHMEAVFNGFEISGFLFLNETIVFFNER
jgi:hypothetical protein